MLEVVLWLLSSQQCHHCKQQAGATAHSVKTPSVFNKASYVHEGNMGYAGANVSAHMGWWSYNAPLVYGSFIWPHLHVVHAMPHHKLLFFELNFHRESFKLRCGMLAGSGTGGTNPGLPQDTDPKDAFRTDRLDDPEELLQRRRAKDPAAFDKVHGKNASFAEETGGEGAGS